MTSTPAPASPSAPTLPWRAPTCPGPLDARVVVPGSKSQTARALVLAAIADAPSEVVGALDSRDTRLMVRALSDLGATVTVAEDPSHLRVTPLASVRPGATVECGLAGTVARFVPALAATAAGTTSFVGDAAASARPARPLLEALTALGAHVIHEGDPGVLPFSVTGPLAPPVAGTRDVGVDASASSQFLSALLLAAPLMGGRVHVYARGPVVSLPHVRMTVEALRSRGVRVDEDAPATAGGDVGAGWTVGVGRPRGGEVVIEPDLTNAGVFLAAACICDGTVRIAHWPAHTTQAGDAWRGLLTRMGARVRRDGEDLVVEGPGRAALRGIDADLCAVGELTPVLAALCTLASGPSRLRGIAHLRGHETDRLAALAAEITRLGGDVDELPDGLDIRPAALHAAHLHSYADHRMATFAALVGLAVPGVTLDDVSCTSKTLPDFPGLWRDLLTGGARGQA